MARNSTSIFRNDQLFMKLIPLVIKSEGGYVNDPDDLGGETKYGITKRRYPSLNIKALTVEQASEIYYRDFWLKTRFNTLPQHLVYQIFDMGINAGPGNAIKILQRAAGINDDGVLGPVTMAAARRVTNEEYYEERCKYYRYIVQARPRNRKFLPGWLKRADQVLKKSAAIAALKLT